MSAERLVGLGLGVRVWDGVTEIVPRGHAPSRPSRTRPFADVEWSYGEYKLVHK